MLTAEDNRRLTLVEGDAPMGQMLRGHYWLPFVPSSHLLPGEAPLPVRLLSQNFIAFRDSSGQIGFLDELCPHRRASLTLARVETDGVRCLYHGWKISAAGCVLEAPTQTSRSARFAVHRVGRRANGNADFLEPGCRSVARRSWRS
jgi:phthalate 4,5-dioxygenase